MSNPTVGKSAFDQIKEAAMESLISSGQFTLEEREAIASAISAGVDRFRQRVLENVQRSTRSQTEQN